MNGALPLEGVRVLEFGQFAAGPFAGLLLADWGADVVKVEPPGGEGLRSWPPFVEIDSDRYSLNFASVNRNKRSIELDLGDGAGQSGAEALIAAADVVLENFRPGRMAGWGLGPDEMLDRHRSLIYCSVSGYGHSGPDSAKGAFDIAIQGMSGLMSVTGEPDGPPAKCGVPIADFLSAVFAALGCVTALRRAERTGQGGHVDCSMLSCVLAASTLQTSEYWGTGQAPKRLGSAHPRNAPYEGFRASDKWFIVAAGNDKLFRRLCQVIDRPELANDARFADQPGRAQHRADLADLLGEVFAERRSEEWLSLLDDNGIPAAPVNDYADVLADPHVVASGIVHQMDLPGGLRTNTIGNPVGLSDYDFEVRCRPPLAGEHTAEVFDEWTTRR